MNPGEIFWADLDSGRRPVIVASRSELNRGEYVQIIPITSMHFEKRSRLPNCVPFRAGEFGLPKDCIAQCEMLTIIRAIQVEMDNGPISVLDESKFREVVKATGYVFCADCEPE